MATMVAGGPVLESLHSGVEEEKKKTLQGLLMRETKQPMLHICSTFR